MKDSLNWNNKDMLNWNNKDTSELKKKKKNSEMKDSYEQRLNFSINQPQLEGGTPW